MLKLQEEKNDTQFRLDKEKLRYKDKMGEINVVENESSRLKSEVKYLEDKVNQMKQNQVDRFAEMDKVYRELDEAKDRLAELFSKYDFY